VSFPSSFLDIQAAVLQKARLDPSNDGARVRDWINQSYTRVCVETEAIVTSATMALTAGAASYTLPPSVARIKQLQLKPLGQANFNAPLVRTTLDEILVRRQAGGDTQQSGNQSGLYALLGINAFEVWPTPPAADVIWIYYVQFPLPLLGTADVPVLEEPYASKLLEFGALADAGDFNGDPATVGWQQDFDTWMTRYLAHLDQKQGVIPGQFHVWGDAWVPELAASAS